MDAPAAAEATRPLRFNPAAPAFIQDPYPTYATMRRDTPRLQAFGTRILTRYDDVLAALRERELSVGLIPDTIARSAARLQLTGQGQVDRFIRGSIVFTDNPAHARLRRLVNQAYAPRSVAQLRPLIDREISRCLDLLPADQAFDFVPALAQPLPVRVLCRWLGVPAEHEADIARHVHRIRLLLDPGLMGRRQCAAAAESLAFLTDFFRNHAAASAASGDGLAAALAGAGSDGDRLGDEEVAFACIMSFVAGTETTQYLLANTVHALASHPAQQELLRRTPALVPAAVEESIRFQTPLQFTKRVARSELVLNGLALAANEQVLLCLGAANRDELAFQDPAAFDLAREPMPHVGFGYGLHACLGALLARVQAEQVLSALLERYSRWQVDLEDVQWQTESLILRGPARLSCRFQRANTRARGLAGGDA